MTDALNALRSRIVDSPGAWIMFEADAYLPFDSDAHRAAQLRLARMWEDATALAHALRGEGLTEDEARALAAKERAAAILEDDARQSSTYEEEDDDWTTN
ncbi:MAG: hypothetical protein V4753_09885 [Pseudomonadota bacterium]